MRVSCSAFVDFRDAVSMNPAESQLCERRAPSGGSVLKTGSGAHRCDPGRRVGMIPYSEPGLRQALSMRWPHEFRRIPGHSRRKQRACLARPLTGGLLKARAAMETDLAQRDLSDFRGRMCAGHAAGDFRLAWRYPRRRMPGVCSCSCYTPVRFHRQPELIG